MIFDRIKPSDLLCDNIPRNISTAEGCFSKSTRGTAHQRKSSIDSHVLPMTPLINRMTC
jgi:hypothetical protein